MSEIIYPGQEELRIRLYKIYNSCFCDMKKYMNDMPKSHKISRDERIYIQLKLDKALERYNEIAQPIIKEWEEKIKPWAILSMSELSAEQLKMILNENK